MLLAAAVLLASLTAEVVLVSITVPVLVALIGGPLMLLMKRFDNRNTEQHNDNKNVLCSILESVNNVDRRVGDLDMKVDTHLLWHLEKELSPHDFP